MSIEYKMPSFDISGKTVIITGATRGLGQGIASTFASFGANVVITARTESDCVRVSENINNRYCKDNRCVAVVADSTSQADIDRAIARTVQEFSALDILINNANVKGKSAKILSDYCDEDNFEKVISTNLKGVFMFSKAAARQMRSQGHGGKIINIASIAGLIGAKGAVAYGAAEAGVISLTRTMAGEFAGYGITVNAVCTGDVVTPMNVDILSNDDIKTNFVSETALGRLARIEDVAGPVLALATDCFSYVTGTYLLVDGGQMIKS